MRTPPNEGLTSIARESEHRFSATSDAISKDPDIVGEGAVRTCVLTGREAVRDGLIRLALAPADAENACAVLPDVRARAPGRGAWIAVSRADLEVALGKNKLKGALMRAFGKVLDGATLAVPADLPERIEVALRRAVTERLGLELRAGRVVLGSDRIAEQARAGRIAWLGHAADASADGSRKLDQALRVGRDAEGTGATGAYLPLDRAALSVALGRDNVVHLALNDRLAAARLAVPLGRLLHYLGQTDAPGAGDPPVRSVLAEPTTEQTN